MTSATTRSKSSGDEDAPKLHSRCREGDAEADAENLQGLDSEPTEKATAAKSEATEGDLGGEHPEAMPAVNLSDWIRLSGRQRWVDTLEDSDEEIGVETAGWLEKGSAELVPADASTMCSESLEIGTAEVEEASTSSIPLWRQRPAQDWPQDRRSSFKGTKRPKRTGRRGYRG